MIIGFAVTTFACLLVGGFFFRFFTRLLGLYVVVQEGTARVYVLFGKVLGVIREPGLHSPISRFGPAALIVNWLGKSYTVDMRLDQEYLRSQPVNSEEGAPMGIGLWYEMNIGDPVSYIFKNADPRGSLRANVSNAAVRCLSNMALTEMLESRHAMSHAVRNEVSPQSEEWGYKLGSVYIRKVHFRDVEMMRQIEGKVVNRLRQVTAAIQQDGTNQVNIIRTTAERQAAIEFAKATALRPQIVGDALSQVASDPEIAGALFQVLELSRLLDSGAEVTLVPADGSANDVLTALVAAPSATPRVPPAPRT
jgi:regulator of protease activity HflC (stomatin/prohibitin superfamily)